MTQQDNRSDSSPAAFHDASLHVGDPVNREVDLEPADIAEVDGTSWFDSTTPLPTWEESQWVRSNAQEGGPGSPSTSQAIHQVARASRATQDLAYTSIASGALARLSQVLDLKVCRSGQHHTNDLMKAAEASRTHLSASQPSTCQSYRRSFLSSLLLSWQSSARNRPNPSSPASVNSNSFGQGAASASIHRSPTQTEENVMGLGLYSECAERESHPMSTSRRRSDSCSAAAEIGPSSKPEVSAMGLVMSVLTPPLAFSKIGGPLCGIVLDSKYLLIGHASGLDFLPLDPLFSAHRTRRPISLIKKTRFRQLAILEERSNILLAVAGRNDHVRVYALDGVRSTIERRLRDLSPTHRISAASVDEGKRSSVAPTAPSDVVSPHSKGKGRALPPPPLAIASQGCYNSRLLHKRSSRRPSVTKPSSQIPSRPVAMSRPRTGSGVASLPSHPDTADLSGRCSREKFACNLSPAGSGKQRANVAWLNGTTGSSSSTEEADLDDEEWADANSSSSSPLPSRQSARMMTRSASVHGTAVADDFVRLLEGGPLSTPLVAPQPTGQSAVATVSAADTFVIPEKPHRRHYQTSGQRPGRSRELTQMPILARNTATNDTAFPRVLPQPANKACNEPGPFIAMPRRRPLCSAARRASAQVQQDDQMATTSIHWSSKSVRQLSPIAISATEASSASVNQMTEGQSTYSPELVPVASPCTSQSRGSQALSTTPDVGRRSSAVDRHPIDDAGDESDTQTTPHRRRWTVLDAILGSITNNGGTQSQAMRRRRSSDDMSRPDDATVLAVLSPSLCTDRFHTGQFATSRQFAVSDQDIDMLHSAPTLREPKTDRKSTAGRVLACETEVAAAADSDDVIFLKYSKAEMHPASTQAPLEYVKLARTKGARILKTAETRKKTYLAILCGDNANRIELFTGSRNVSLSLNRTFVLPETPRSIELQLQGDELVDIYLVYDRSIFALEPSTVRVREVDVARNERRAARRERERHRSARLEDDQPLARALLAGEDNQDSLQSSPMNTSSRVESETITHSAHDLTQSSHVIEEGTRLNSACIDNDSLATAVSANNSAAANLRPPPAKCFSTWQQLAFIPPVPPSILASSFLIPPTYDTVVGSTPQPKQGEFGNIDAASPDLPAIASPDMLLPLLSPISLLGNHPSRNAGPPGLFFVSRGRHMTDIVDSDGRSVMRTAIKWDTSKAVPHEHSSLVALDNVQRLELIIVDNGKRTIIVAFGATQVQAAEMGSKRGCASSEAHAPLFDSIEIAPAEVAQRKPYLPTGLPDLRDVQYLGRAGEAVFWSERLASSYAIFCLASAA